MYNHILDIEQDFKDQLNVYVPLLLDESNIVLKEINGTQISCRELLEYFKVSIYFTMFQTFVQGLIPNIFALGEEDA